MSSKRPPNLADQQEPGLGLPALGAWLLAVAPTPVGEVASRATEAERQIAFATGTGPPARLPGPRNAARLPRRPRATERESSAGLTQPEERERRQTPQSFLVKRSARLRREAQLTTGNAAPAKIRLAEAVLAFWRGDYEVARERMRRAQLWDPTGEMTGVVGRRMAELLDRRRDLADLLPKTP